MKQLKRIDLHDREIISTIVCLVISLVYFAFLYSCVPLGSDDWGWGGSEGYSRLTNFFSGYNGRYLGNLTVMAMTRSKFIRVAIMTMTTILIGVLVSYYTAGRFRRRNYLLTLLLLLLSIVPGFFNSHMNLFASTLGWVSGFSNYVCPAVPILAYFIYADKDYLQPDRTHTKRELPWLCLLGFVSCLYVENITFFCVLLGAAVNAYFYTVRKKLYAGHIAYLAGTFLGALAMVANPAYYQMFLGEYVGDSKSKFREVGLISGSSVTEAISKLELKPVILIVLAFAALAVLTATATLPIFLTKDRQESIRLYAPLLSAVLLIVPLLFANGGHYYLFTIRIYFLPYVMMLVNIIQVLSAVCGGLSAKWKTAVKAFAACALCVCAVFVGCLYYKINTVESAMEKYLKQQISAGSQSIEVIEFPAQFDGFIYAPNTFSNSAWAKKFKDYYGIGPDVKLVPISYNDYMAK